MSHISSISTIISPLRTARFFNSPVSILSAKDSKSRLKFVKALLFRPERTTTLTGNSERTRIAAPRYRYLAAGDWADFTMGRILVQPRLWRIATPTSSPQACAQTISMCVLIRATLKPLLCVSMRHIHSRRASTCRRTSNTTTILKTSVQTSGLAGSTPPVRGFSSCGTTRIIAARSNARELLQGPSSVSSSSSTAGCLIRHGSSTEFADVFCLTMKRFLTTVRFELKNCS